MLRILRTERKVDSSTRDNVQIVRLLERDSSTEDWRFCSHYGNSGNSGMGLESTIHRKEPVSSLTVKPNTDYHHAIRLRLLSKSSDTRAPTIR